MDFQVPEDLTTLSERELRDLIKQVTEEERKVSDRRVKVQDRLDFLRGSASGTADSSLLDKLTGDEERISGERKQLHSLIDLLYAERNRRSRGG
jgi:hypothetical protein